MIVYRLEHQTIKSWTGAFAGPMRQSAFYQEPWAYQNEVNHALDACRESMGRFPTPWGDPLLNGIEQNEICGLESMEWVHDWFGDSLPLYLDLGFVIRKYDVPECNARRGTVGQILFDEKRATVAATLKGNEDE